MTRNLEKRVERLEDEQPDNDSIDVHIKRLLVIPRERAERENREILDVADTPGETEYVTVEP